MSDIKLSISDKALEFMKKKGKEFHLLEKTVSAGWRGNVKAVLVEDGPAPSSEYNALKDGEITVWVPSYMNFRDNTLKLDLGGLPWARSIIIVQ